MTAARNNLACGSAESAISLVTTADLPSCGRWRPRACWRSPSKRRGLAGRLSTWRPSPRSSLTVAAGRNNIVAAAATERARPDGCGDVRSCRPHVGQLPNRRSAWTRQRPVRSRPGWAWDWIDLWDWATVTVVRKVAAQSPLALVQTEVTARPWYLSAESRLQTVTEEYDPRG